MDTKARSLIEGLFGNPLLFRKSYSSVLIAVADTNIVQPNAQRFRIEIISTDRARFAVAAQPVAALSGYSQIRAGEMVVSDWKLDADEPAQAWWGFAFENSTTVKVIEWILTG